AIDWRVLLTYRSGLRGTLAVARSYLRKLVVDVSVYKREERLLEHVEVLGVDRVVRHVRLNEAVSMDHVLDRLVKIGQCACANGTENCCSKDGAFGYLEAFDPAAVNI